jgi:hypothetical protein
MSRQTATKRPVGSAAIAGWSCVLSLVALTGVVSPHRIGVVVVVSRGCGGW